MNPDKIKIIMVGTTHPGNIGAAARAMNNMCFTQLVLVEPKCPIGEIAYARASGANSILDNRIIVPDLKTAIADCELVIGSTARLRSLQWPQLQPRELVPRITALGEQASTALVFGREHSGLTNEEIQCCNYVVSIPTNPKFSSLNVASAVQVLCYEIFSSLAEIAPLQVTDEHEQVATSADVEGYFEHLQQVLESTDFIDPEKPGLIMQRLRRLYLRCDMNKNEVNILRGMLTAINKKLKV
jgi:tRNA (cytidine32/uridine32-2'-O)-methyltransferase